MKPNLKRDYLVPSFHPQQRILHPKHFIHPLIVRINANLELSVSLLLPLLTHLTRFIFLQPYMKTNTSMIIWATRNENDPMIFPTWFLRWPESPNRGKRPNLLEINVIGSTTLTLKGHGVSYTIYMDPTKFIITFYIGDC